MQRTPSLPVRSKAAYGIGSTAEAAIGMAFNAFNFLFYNNVLGLSGTLCGLAVTIALVFDAVSDPLVGSISDRWRSRLGRRHPFLYAAPIPMALFFYCIYSPPEGLTSWGLFAWFTTFTVLLRGAQTLYHVPHLALGAEMTTDYRERSVLMSYNTAFHLIGTFSVFFLGWSYFGTLEEGTGNRAGYSVLATGIALFAATAVFASAYFTRDQIPRLSRAPSGLSRFGIGELFREIRVCLTNRNYARLVLGLLFLSATLGLQETLTSHLNLFFWELPAEQIRYLVLGAPPGLLLATFFAPALHVRFGKRNSLIGSIVATCLTIAGPVVLRLVGWFPENGEPALFPMLAVAKGISYCVSAVMLISIVSTLADVTDEHELLTGRRQEGVFFAARSFFGKLTSGLGHLLAGLAMDVIRFPTGATPGEIAPGVLWEFGLLSGPLTVLPALASVWFYWKYDIDEARHTEIRRELDRRGRAAEPPAGRTGPD